MYQLLATAFLALPVDKLGHKLKTFSHLNNIFQEYKQWKKKQFLQHTTGSCQLATSYIVWFPTSWPTQ